MKIEQHIKTQEQFNSALAILEGLDIPGPVLLKVVDDHESRSDKQRRLQHVWYRAMYNQDKRSIKTAFDSVQDITCYCKLKFGIPILMRDNEEANVRLNRILPHLSEEHQKDAMIDFPVTRLFNVKQNVEYLNAMEQFAWGRGWVLPNKDDLYYESMGYKRSAA